MAQGRPAYMPNATAAAMAHASPETQTTAPASLPPLPDLPGMPAEIVQNVPTDRQSGRDSPRMPAREYYRSMARPEPVPSGHLKYHIDKGDFVDGCDHVWVPIRVNGMDSGQLREYLSRGWVPARACDFPKHSGFGTDYPDAIRRGGFVKNVQADDPIELDGEMLFVRSEELSRQSEFERNKLARDQVETQFQRLELMSKKSLGSKADDLALSRTRHGKQFVNPDNFRDEPSGREV